MRSFFQRLGYAFFGDGVPVPERAPQPASRTDLIMGYCGVVFLIAVAAYLPIRVFADQPYCVDRKRAMLEKCILSTKDFRWCWINMNL